jgi:DNA-binding HxlR family transcriptional regulator
MVVTNTDVRIPQAISECKALAAVLARIGDKWTVMVIGNLQAGPLRYNELRRRIEGISQRMLTLTLKGLEEDGLVTRTVFPTVPITVEYALTDLGRSLHEPLMEMLTWAIAHQPEIEQSRQDYQRRSA